MFRAVVLSAALLGVVLSGCLADERNPDLSVGQTGLPAFTLAGLDSHGEPLLYEGARLVGEAASNANSVPPFLPKPPRPECAGANCETVPLVLDVPDNMSVAIGFEWEAQDETWHTAGGLGYYLGDAATRLDAYVLRDGEEVLDIEESFHYGGVGILDRPEPGRYDIRVIAAKGTTSYYLSVHLVDGVPSEDDTPPVELLPDLVALPPDHPTFRMPLGHEAGTPGGVTLAGCGPDETGEDLHLRCLRFAGIIGNQGPGDFHTVLEFSEAERALAGLEGHWEQVITASDGSERKVRIGPADYHEVHGHFHILAFVATQLYTYDEEAQARGEPVGDGRKLGFCVIDGGIIDLFAPLSTPKFHGDGCCYIAGFCQVDMLFHDRFQMGMSPNWYDIYPWWRSGQYVEVSGLPDGVYELVSIINPDGLILEADTTNNEASSVLRIAGDQVEVLSMKTQARLGPHPDADWGYAAQRADAEG
ncbi:MAG: hypothetical protein KY455_13310 [Euryarchaeota archaeon]|nr:hypothetical protein [Euryarchaeota archaeon]